MIGLYYVLICNQEVAGSIPVPSTFLEFATKTAPRFSAVFRFNVRISANLILRKLANPRSLRSRRLRPATERDRARSLRDAPARRHLFSTSQDQRPLNTRRAGEPARKCSCSWMRD